MLILRIALFTRMPLPYGLFYERVPTHQQIQLLYQLTLGSLAAQKSIYLCGRWRVLKERKIKHNSEYSLLHGFIFGVSGFFHGGQDK